MSPKRGSHASRKHGTPQQQHQHPQRPAPQSRPDGRDALVTPPVQPQLTKLNSATMNTPLPPSVEKAYHTKCIELKRRLNEIEEANDAARIRKRRLDRSIEKLRLERAFLFDKLAKTQQFLPDDSDKDTSPPPTVYTSPSRSSHFPAPAPAASGLACPLRKSNPSKPDSHREPYHLAPSLQLLSLEPTKESALKPTRRQNKPNSLVAAADLLLSHKHYYATNSLVSASDLRASLLTLHDSADPPMQPQERPSRKPRSLAPRANGSAGSPGAETSMLASSPVASGTTI